MIVKESISFQRGLNSKEILRVGKYKLMDDKIQEFINFVLKEMGWNDPRITIKDEGFFLYDCLPGNSVIPELREVVQNFGWGKYITVMKDPDDLSSRYHDDGAFRHFYNLKWKSGAKEKLLKNL